MRQLHLSGETPSLPLSKPLLVVQRGASFSVLSVVMNRMREVFLDVGDHRPSKVLAITDPKALAPPPGDDNVTVSRGAITFLFNFILVALL
jgi:hypothetical protein